MDFLNEGLFELSRFVNQMHAVKIGLHNFRLPVIFTGIIFYLDARKR